MVLKLQNAYFKDTVPRQRIVNYLGAETLSLRVARNGNLRQLELQSLPVRPASQPPVTAPLPSPRRRHPLPVLLNTADREPPRMPILPEDVIAWWQFLIR